MEELSNCVRLWRIVEKIHNCGKSSNDMLLFEYEYNWAVIITGGYCGKI